jgi:hypothetical protein
MIRDSHNPMYHMLTEDDIILVNDEYYDYTTDNWYRVDQKHIGDLYKGPYGYYHFIIIRRKNPEYIKNEPWI